MLEIELFYKIVEAKIREKHTVYLECKKREAVQLELPVVDELPEGDAWKQLNLFVRYKLKKQRKQQLKALKKAERKRHELHIQERLLRGYNSGVKMALKVLADEYDDYKKRLDSQAGVKRKP